MSFNFSLSESLEIANNILNLVEPMWVLIDMGYVMRFVDRAFPKRIKEG